MTIAELQNGLAAKLTKTDLNGYATQTWTQNQIKMTADGINGTMSSIKSTVDGQTTSINDLKADSSSFKSQFTTVNNTLGKQTTDIGTLQATSKELTTGFNTLTSDNTTNKNDISQLKQTATEVSSTLETVQTQVQNSAVGTNLLKGTGDHTVTNTGKSYVNGYLSNETTDDLLTLFKGLEGQTVTVSVDYEYSGFVAGSYNNRLGFEIKIVADTTNYFGTWYYPNNDSGSGRLSKTFVVPKNITEIGYANGYVQLSGSGIGTASHLKLEKGSLATDWCPNPADNATVTAVSKLSQTVDGMKADISKKIEKKDLNGYATETWAQNQINISANGINGTISSVKSTVDGHTTSINALQADSSGFKAQFQTVNDTIGKHTTDIGTLQASTKSLSASFDSLSTDNGNNKHDIGQLQASATAFNSTLLTVQQQVTDSAVGINLLRNTKDYSDWSKWSGEGNVDPTIVRDYAFTDLIQITGLTNSGKFSASMAGGGPVYLVTGQSYTFSVYAKAYTKSGAGLGINLGLYGDYTSQMQAGGGLSITKFINGDWTRYSVTFVAKGSGPFGGWRVLALSTNSLEDLISIYLWGLKLEKGTIATNYSNNPADDASAIAVSSISQTIDSIKITVRGKVDNDVYQSKVTQLDSQITSVVGQVNNLGQTNIIYNSEFTQNAEGWSKTANFYVTSGIWSDSTTGGMAIHTKTGGDQWYALLSKKIPILSNENTKYSASCDVIITSTSDDSYSYAQVMIEYLNESGTRSSYKNYDIGIRADSDANNTIPANKSYTVQLNGSSPDANAKYVRMSLRIRGIAYVRFKHPMLVIGDTVGQYQADTVGSAEIALMNNNINLKVSKDGVVNAINVSKEGTSIYGNKLHITAATYIDNAVIKDAMIANLSADKLTAGTINAANINVINLNANNITTGTIKGSNLSINLNTGNVEFQAGRIHSSDNTIDININNKYISVANSNNRVFISGGEIQMIQPTLLSRQATPYVRITNEGAGATLGGATFWARDYFAVTHRYNDSGIFSSPGGTESFSGISGGKSTGGWQVTKVGGADRGVFISGGRAYSNGFISYSPYIRVGDNGNSGAGMSGSNISMQGDYIYLKSQHTTSKGANAYLAPDGALVPSTSAAKYKTDIVRSFETEMGNKLLEVPVAHWKDKEEVLAKTRDSNAKDPETYFGMIADDLDDAGLKELVDYDDKGEVRGIQYDRVVLSLIPLIRNYRDRITELETEVKQMKEV
ncbi:gp58-like family protein [Lactiplantibacillus pentosus]|uniref:gp58-like family protein n=1 Tax=Lactiplantibacillus pentosus TaxID=1589 RepID=UPI003F5330E2